MEAEQEHIGLAGIVAQHGGRVADRAVAADQPIVNVVMYTGFPTRAMPLTNASSRAMTACEFGWQGMVLIGVPGRRLQLNSLFIVSDGHQHSDQHNGAARHRRYIRDLGEHDECQNRCERGFKSTQ